MRPTSPFTEADRVLFEDGVDLIGDPAGLSGQWADEWATSLRDRVARADLVAVVSVNTLRSDVDLERRTTHALVADLGEVFKGQYSGELVLSASQDAIGFSSVERERGNILHRPLVVFAKWVRDEAGNVRAHWHLAPASRRVEEAVRVQISGRSATTQTRIIEHAE